MSSTAVESNDLRMGTPITHKERQGEKVLSRYNLAQKVVGIAMVILFVLSAVFVCMALFDKIHPLVSVGALGGSMLCWIVIQVIDCCRSRAASTHNIDLKAFDAAARGNEKSSNDSDSDSDHD